VALWSLLANRFMLGEQEEFMNRDEWQRERQRALDRAFERAKFAQWLYEQEFDFMITINSNDPTLNYARARDAFKRFDAVLDRYFLG
jgi:hypothetical protein